MTKPKTISFSGAVVKNLGYKRLGNTPDKVYQLSLVTEDGSIMNLDALDEEVTFTVVMAPEGQS